MHREFAGAGAEEVSADPDVVAEVEQLVKLKSFFTYGIFLHVNLQALSGLLQVREASFAHEADCHDAPGDAHVDAWILQLFSSLLGIGGENVWNRVGEIVLAGVRLLSEGFNLLELVAAQFVDLFVEGQGILASGLK